MIAKFWNNFKNFDQKFSFSFLGLALSVFYIIYTEFIKIDKPIIDFEILTNTNVIDLKEENLSSLNIIYKNKSITEEKKDLRILTFKVINNGRKSLLIGDLDPNDPLGFEIIDGVVVDDPVVILSNNTYISKNIRIVNMKGNLFSWNNVIMDPGDFFIIKFLVSVDKPIIPKVKAIGKIAGNRKLNVYEMNEKNPEEGTLQKVASGNFIIHALRFIIYFSIIILILITTFVALIRLQKWYELSKRDALTKKFKKLKMETQDPIFDFVLNEYMKKGSRFIRGMLTLVESPSKLENIYGLILEYNMLGKDLLKLDLGEKNKHYKVFHLSNDGEENVFYEIKKPYDLDFYERVISSMIKNGVLEIKELKPYIDTSFTIFLKEFVFYLNSQ